MKRLRGLKDLVVDAVEHGSRSIERVQKDTARLPFDILEQIPPIAAPVKGVRWVYDVGLSTTHGMIRLVTRVVGVGLDKVLDVVEAEREEGDPPPSAR